MSDHFNIQVGNVRLVRRTGSPWVEMIVPDGAVCAWIETGAVHVVDEQGAVVDPPVKLPAPTEEDPDADVSRLRGADDASPGPGGEPDHPGRDRDPDGGRGPVAGYRLGRVAATREEGEPNVERRGSDRAWTDLLRAASGLTVGCIVRVTRGHQENVMGCVTEIRVTDFGDGFVEINGRPESIRVADVELGG